MESGTRRRCVRRAVSRVSHTASGYHSPHPAPRSPCPGNCHAVTPNGSSPSDHSPAPSRSSRAAAVDGDGSDSRSISGGRVSTRRLPKSPLIGNHTLSASLGGLCRFGGYFPASAGYRPPSPPRPPRTASRVRSLRSLWRLGFRVGGKPPLPASPASPAALAPPPPSPRYRSGTGLRSPRLSVVCVEAAERG